MKYLVSFRTTLKISRYLFRALALMLWFLGALLTTFYVVSVLHEEETQIRQELSSGFEQLQWYVRHTSNMARELKNIAESEQTKGSTDADTLVRNQVQPRFYAFSGETGCPATSQKYHPFLRSLTHFLHYWKNRPSSSYDSSLVFFVDNKSMCMADFSSETYSVEKERAMTTIYDHILRYRDNPKRQEIISWISAASQTNRGYFYTMLPVYVTGELTGFIGVERSIQLDSFFASDNLPVTAAIIDQNDQPQLFSSRNNLGFAISDLPRSENWFGYTDNYRQLVMRKSLPSSPLSIIYSLPSDILLERIKLLIINTLLLNFLSAIALFFLARLFERRMFWPAEENAHQLEEHEQFNRKIVASAPVGICILRTEDGANLISNELAHNYLTLLTQEDRQHLTTMIRGQQVNFVDLLTGSNTNLQISFVHSRYRNENVAICVLVDVSARVKMEKSLQEVARVAEQASQSKSMFLATVSHELRTPLYGIIGNLDLLQTKKLPEGVASLVTSMNNSSSLLLKIISDILDFSKIESEQLKIESHEFSPREVLRHITSNYLSLVVKKRLTLYCFIDYNVPVSMCGDPLRLQQVISNLLNNAIKFTHTGLIILHAVVKEGYLTFCIRDTGVGIAQKELDRLFDPFVQVGSSMQRHFQGTGLGLAICEKLTNMMDGDIQVDSGPGMGSRFIVRIPVYRSQTMMPIVHDSLADKTIWLSLCNNYLEEYLSQLLQHHKVFLRKVDERNPCHAAEDVIITDKVLEFAGPVRAVIQFDGRHIDAPKESNPGYWICSTATPHELPALLGKIYQVAVEIPSGSPQPHPAEEPGNNNEDILILIVDDHPINRMLLSDQLGLLGYQIKTARDGVDALHVISRTHIDIVLSDVNMPNMDGYRLTQRLRQLGQTFPVIGITANALDEQKQRCIEAGMDNCLSKPVTLDTLKTTLAIYAERVRNTREEASI